MCLIIQKDINFNIKCILLCLCHKLYEVLAKNFMRPYYQSSCDLIVIFTFLIIHENAKSNDQKSLSPPLIIN